MKSKKILQQTPFINITSYQNFIPLHFTSFYFILLKFTIKKSPAVAELAFSSAET